jgi:hypothetical protein
MRNSVCMVNNKPRKILRIFWTAFSRTYFRENRQPTGKRVRSHILEEENHLPAYNYVSLKQRKNFKPVKEMGVVRPSPPVLHLCLNFEQ